MRAILIDSFHTKLGFAPKPALAPKFLITVYSSKFIALAQGTYIYLYPITDSKFRYQDFITDTCTKTLLLRHAQRLYYFIYVLDLWQELKAT